MWMRWRIARKSGGQFVKMDREHARSETRATAKDGAGSAVGGLIGKEVADQLNISEGTVRKHIRIFIKLQVNTRVKTINLYLRR